MRNHLLYFLFLCIVCNTATKAQTITTIAGTGTYGFFGDGGLATAAQFKSPRGIIADNSGNIYISDYENHRVRKISPSGVITTIGGNGTATISGDGGPATAAGIAFPAGLALDKLGNLYIAEPNMGIIRKINTSGIVSRYAGDNPSSVLGDGGPATAADLNLPINIAIDTAGNLYIADVSAHRVRKVNTAGVITTFAGTGSGGLSGDGGPANAAQLDRPFGVAADKNGNIYIADSDNRRIRKVNAAGIISTYAGNGSSVDTGDGGPALWASMYTLNVLVDPFGHAVVNTLYRVRIINNAGIINRLAGSSFGFGGDGGPAVLAQMASPTQSFIDTAGNLYIADMENNRIRYVAGALCTAAPTAGTVASSLSSDCYSYNLSLVGSSTNSYGITYQWYSSPTGSTYTAIAGATLGTYVAGVSSPTYFQCRVICSNTGLYNTTPGVLVNPVVTHTASITPSGSATICTGDSATLTANTVAAGITYQWLKDGGAIPGATNMVYKAHVQGYYSVIETNALGCGAYSNTDTVNVVGLLSPNDTTICKGTSLALSYHLKDTTQAFDNFIFYAKDPTTGKWAIWRKNVFTNNYQPIFNDFYNRVNAVVSADGREMIYIKYRPQPAGGMSAQTMDSAWICRSTSGGLNERIVFVVPQFNKYAIYDLDWSADKQKILFSNGHDRYPITTATRDGDVFVFHYNTNLITNITALEDYWSKYCKFSPSDTSFAFTRANDPYSAMPQQVAQWSIAGMPMGIITSSGTHPWPETECVLTSFDVPGEVVYRRGYTNASLYKHTIGGSSSETLLTTTPGYSGIYLTNGIYAATDTNNNIRLFRAGGALVGSINVPVISKFKNDGNYQVYSNFGASLNWLGAHFSPRPVFAWATGDTTPSINVAPITNKTYYCTTTLNGISCTDSVKITVDNPIAPVIAGPDINCIGTNDVIFSYPAGGSWSSSNANATVTGGTVTGVTPGAVTISYSFNNKCGTFTDTHNMAILTSEQCDSITAVHGAITESGLKVFPNPTEGQFTVEIPGVAGEATISVIDVYGRVVAALQTRHPSQLLELREMARGIYFVKVSTQGKSYMGKIELLGR
jgi:hypothetical protein